MYLMLSVAHKLGKYADAHSPPASVAVNSTCSAAPVAIIYYYQNMSTVIKLGNSMFYSREAWVRMLSHRDAT